MRQGLEESNKLHDTNFGIKQATAFIDYRSGSVGAKDEEWIQTLRSLPAAQLKCPSSSLLGKAQENISITKVAATKWNFFTSVSPPADG